MVTPFSDGGGFTLPLFAVGLISGLLIVTNFLEFSAAGLTIGLALRELAGGAFFWATGLTASGFLTGVAVFAEWDLPGFLTDFAGAAFFTGIFFTGIFFDADFEAGFDAALAGFADFTGFFTAAFFAASGFFAAGLVPVLRAADFAARATGFARADFFVAFADLTGLRWVFAISLAYLVTRRSRVIA